MSNLDDRERQACAAVEDALNTFPLSPVSPTLYLATMARVRAVQPVPRFRLGWMDYALAVLAVVMIAVFLMVWRVIPAQMLQSTRIDVLLAVQGFTPAILLPTLGAGLILIVAAAVAAAVMINAPASGRIIRPR